MSRLPRVTAPHAPSPPWITPPNTTRTLCEAQEYAYALTGGNCLGVNLYGNNTLTTKELVVEQQTDYPWDGKVRLTFKKVKDCSCVMLHIPDWCDKYSIAVNGEDLGPNHTGIIQRKFKKGDVIDINFEMRPRLIEANPLVEEAKNQVAVKRGPIVYCLEGQDIEGGYRINDIALPADIRLKEVPMEIAGHRFTALEGEVNVVNNRKWDNHTLYRELQQTAKKTTKIRLIPYYAWDNRGNQDMSLWLPLVQ